MNFLLLAIQSSVCCLCVITVKTLGIISFRPFDWNDAKAWFPISALLVSVIYTGSKSLVRVLPSRVVASNTKIQPAIPEHTSLYNLQELDNHLNRSPHGCFRR